MPAPVRPNLPLTSSFLYDALILGAGPAGLSTALTLSRQARPCAVFSSEEFRNAKASHAHTILSRDHQPAASIRRIAREQIDAYGTTKFVERRALSARKDEGEGVFEVQDEQGETWRGKKVVLATGVRDVLPEDIEGYEECWGHSIWQCLFCDGLERSDRAAGLLGFEGPMALHNILMMFQLGCPSVTVFSNGPLNLADEAAEEALKVAEAKGARVEERRIWKLVHLEGEEGIDVVFEDGEKMRIGFLVHQPPTAVAARDVAEDLGVEIVPDGRGGSFLKRNEPMGESNVPGVFVAGDAGVLMKQFTIAMAQGVGAGGAVSFQLIQEEEKRVRTQHGF